jgi:hypothetical protein
LKKILTLAIIFLLVFSTPSILTPEAKAETFTTLYAGTTNPGVVYEYKGGTTWTSISSSLGWSVTSLITYDGKLYAAVITDPYIYSSVGKVYRYDGVFDWTLIGTLDNQVTFLIVYKGELYAGTATPARLYKYNPVTTSWTKVLEYGLWYGFRSAYVWGDWLYLGEWYYDRFARWNGVTFDEFQPYYWGSCIYSIEEYGNYLYAGAYIGRIYKVTSEPATATAIWGPAPNYRYAWSLKSFKGHLYIGFDANGTRIAPLYRYDGTSFTQVWSYSTTTTNYHEGIISMATDGTYLYVGVGGQAVGYPTYMSGEGTGKVYRTLDGTTFELVSGIMGTGVQVLYTSIAIMPSPPTELKIGDIIETTSPRYVRDIIDWSNPRDPENILFTMPPPYTDRTSPPNNVGKIIDGPKIADGYVWWKVEWDNDEKGWTAECSLDQPSVKYLKKSDKSFIRLREIEDAFNYQGQYTLDVKKLTDKENKVFKYVMAHAKTKKISPALIMAIISKETNFAEPNDEDLYGDRFYHEGHQKPNQKGDKFYNDFFGLYEYLAFGYMQLHWDAAYDAGYVKELEYSSIYEDRVNSIIDKNVAKVYYNQFEKYINKEKYPDNDEGHCRWLKDYYNWFINWKRSWCYGVDIPESEKKFLVYLEWPEDGLNCNKNINYGASYLKTRYDKYKDDPAYASPLKNAISAYQLSYPDKGNKRSYVLKVLESDEQHDYKGYRHYLSIRNEKQPLSTIEAKSPVDLIVTDPDNLTINKEIGEILGVLYYIELDIEEDGDLDDMIIVLERKIGDYLITVIPEPSTSFADTYTLEASIGNTTVVLAMDVKVSDIPLQPYIIRSTEAEIIPIIPATVDIDPDTLNLKSGGIWVTVYIELPVGHGYNVSMVNFTSVMLNGQILAEAKPIEIGDYDSDGIPDLMMKFNRTGVKHILETGERVKITISGTLIDGRLFEGKDIIKVVLPP